MASLQISDSIYLNHNIEQDGEDELSKICRLITS